MPRKSYGIIQGIMPRSRISRREWLRRTVSSLGGASGALLLPGLTGVPPAESGVGASAASAPQTGANALSRERLLADFGWRFHLGHANDPAKDFGFGQGRVFDKVGRLFTPSGARFDDSGWQPVDLPHDWAVDLPFVDAAELVDFGCKPLGRNYPETSIGWYRRVFDIPASDNGRRISIEFDGVFRNATVALNGHLLGTNFSGYAPVRYDITDLVAYGGVNVLVVRVDATEREGWFYEGAGIYRHVWLTKTASVHIAHDGIFVTTELQGSNAIVTVQTEVINDSDAVQSCHVEWFLEGKTTSSSQMSLDPWTRQTVTQRLTLANAQPWSPDVPHLYNLLTAVVPPLGSPVDQVTTRFGVRSIRFDPDNGLILNGSRLELKGTCNHQDHAGLGAALPDAIQHYRVSRLKAMGSNAYRTAHNPPTPELLDACDRLGMLVLDETRLFSGNDEGLSQLERMIRRDRNHPCVFAWSIANEEWSDQGNDRGRRIAGTLRRRAHDLDPSRPVTAAMDSAYENPNGISLAVDVQGFNYQRENIDAFHQKFPAKPTMGTETASAFATRGVYAADQAKGYVSAYDVNKPSYGATAEEWWTYYAARPFLAGGFVWTGFDYRGEPSPYKWPCISSHFGILDTCGFEKDSFYYYRAWWDAAPVIHLFPHWNWAGREGELIDVWCFTNLERVELFVNGASAGIKDVPRNSHVSWKVPYAPGFIEARGLRPTAAPLVMRRETTGPPATIVLRCDRDVERDRLAADGEDAAVIRVEITDANGRVVPTASNVVAFKVSDTGHILGVGNGDPSSHEPDHASERRAFNGLCMAIVQARTQPAGDGVRPPIVIEASSPGLTSAALTLEIGRTGGRRALL